MHTRCPFIDCNFDRHPRQKLVSMRGDPRPCTMSNKCKNGLLFIFKMCFFKISLSLSLSFSSQQHHSFSAALRLASALWGRNDGLCVWLLKMGEGWWWGGGERVNGWGEIAALAPCILGLDWGEVGWVLCFVVFKVANSVARTFWEEGSRRSRYKSVIFFSFCLMAEIGNLGNWSYDNTL